MPRKITVTFEDGSTHTYENAPDNVTPEEVTARAQKDFGKTVTALDGGRNRGGQQPPQSSQAPQSPPSYAPVSPDTYVDPSTLSPEELFPYGNPDEEGFYPHSPSDVQAGRETLNIPEVAPPQEIPQNKNEGPGFFYNPFSDPERAMSDLSMGAGNVVEGIMDLPALVGNPLNAGINSIFGTNLSTDLSGTAREALGLKEDNSILGEIQRGVAGGLAFSGAAGAAGKQAGNALQKGLYEVGNTPVRDAVAGGSAAAASGVTEALGGGPVAQTVAGLAGGVAGFKSGDIAEALGPNARAARWATKEAEKNPLAAYQSEVAKDLMQARDNLKAVTPGGIAPRAELTAKAINAVEGTYFTEYKNLINKMGDLSDVQKAKLKGMVTEKYVPKTADEIDAELGDLAGTVEGEAVKQSVLKVNALRAMTPEIKGKTGGLEKVANALDFVPGIPGIVPRGMRALSKASGDGEAARVNAAEKIFKRQKAYEKLGEITGPSGFRESQQALWEKAAQNEAEMAAAKSAEKEAADLAKAERNRRTQVEKAWQKMSEKTPSPSQVARQQDTAFNQAERAAAAQRKAEEEAMWSQYEAQNNPVKVPKSQVSEEEASWRNILKIAEQRKQAQIAKDKATYPNLSFDTPKTKAQPKDTVDALIQRGIKGEGRALSSLANSTGLSNDDAARVLEAVKQDMPELSREVDRVVSGYNTTRRDTGTLLRPAMQAKMKELGIEPKSPASASPKVIPIDEAAQARLANIDPRTVQELGIDPSQVTKREVDLLEELDRVDPIRIETGSEDGSAREYTRDSAMGEDFFRPEDVARAQEIRDELKQISELRWRDVRRPGAHADAKARNIAQANDSIAAMQSDNRISREALESIGNAPRQIRDNIIFIDEAEDYILNRVIPDLQAEGYSSREINAIRSYLFEVANAKRYRNRADAEKNGMTSGPGRPRKQ